MAEFLKKQWYSVIDARTTLVCLNLAGQIRSVDEPFDSLNGAIDAPPAHYGCRGIVSIYIVGAYAAQKNLAKRERERRPAKDRDPKRAKWPGLPPKPTPRKKLRAPTRARRRRRKQ